MSYIGKTPTVGNFIKLDAITTSATNSYTLQHNSVNFSPESANHMLVSLNGVIQAPNTSFSVSGSTITFLPSSGTLSSSDSIDFIMVYGNVLDVGVASTVTDGSITKAKMNLISDSSSAGLTIKGDGGSENGTLQLNCSQNSHGVKLSSPAHSSGQSYEMVLPTTNITAGKFLKVDSVSGSGATGVGQLSFADAGGITNARLWYYTSTTTVGTSDVKLTNWSAHNGSQIGSIGTDMTHSSGDFTFPSTGIWLIQARIGYYISGSSEARFIYSNIRSSTNSGGSYTLVDEAVSNIANVDSSGNDLGTTFNQYILDVTDASTQRIAIYSATASSVGQIEVYNKATNLLFIRLGDT